MSEMTSYKVAVGRAWVEIDFQAQAIYVRLVDTPVATTRRMTGQPEVSGRTEEVHCICGHILGSEECCNFDGADFGLCIQCGEALTTEEAIRSDFCLTCDPPSSRGAA